MALLWQQVVKRLQKMLDEAIREEAVRAKELGSSYRRQWQALEACQCSLNLVRKRGMLGSADVLSLAKH